MFTFAYPLFSSGMKTDVRSSASRTFPQPIRTVPMPTRQWRRRLTVWAAISLLPWPTRQMCRSRRAEARTEARACAFVDRRQVGLYWAVREIGISQSELARRLNVRENGRAPDAGSGHRHETGEDSGCAGITRQAGCHGIRRRRIEVRSLSPVRGSRRPLPPGTW